MEAHGLYDDMPAELRPKRDVRGEQDRAAAKRARRRQRAWEVEQLAIAAVKSLPAMAALRREREARRRSEEDARARQPTPARRMREVAAEIASWVGRPSTSTTATRRRPAEHAGDLRRPGKVVRSIESDHSTDTHVVVYTDGSRRTLTATEVSAERKRNPAWPRPQRARPDVARLAAAGQRETAR